MQARHARLCIALYCPRAHLACWGWGRATVQLSEMPAPYPTHTILRQELPKSQGMLLSLGLVCRWRSRPQRPCTGQAHRSGWGHDGLLEVQHLHAAVELWLALLLSRTQHSRDNTAQAACRALAAHPSSSAAHDGDSQRITPAALILRRPPALPPSPRHPAPPAATPPAGGLGGPRLPSPPPRDRGPALHAPHRHQQVQAHQQGGQGWARRRAEPRCEPPPAGAQLLLEHRPLVGEL